MTVGNVYILTNPRVNGIVKIGKTNNLERRLLEINSHAGVAGKWQVAGYVVCADMDRLERLVHQYLNQCRDRKSGGYEMFECSADAAGEAIFKSSQNYDVKIYEDFLPKTMREYIVKQQRAEDEKRTLLLIEENTKKKRLEQEAVEKNKKAAESLKKEIEDSFILMAYENHIHHRGKLHIYWIISAFVFLIIFFVGEKKNIGLGWSIFIFWVVSSGYYWEKVYINRSFLTNKVKVLYEKAVSLYGQEEIETKISLAEAQLDSNTKKKLFGIYGK